MAHVIVIHCNADALHAVVVGRHVSYTGVDAVLEIPIADIEEPKEIGLRLAEALAPHKPGRATIVLAAGREMLSWQHLELPPCPAEELPDLVKMQADYDASHATDSVGFDFLPLVGDDQTPHRVLAVWMNPVTLKTLQIICESADLSPKRIIPLSVGWPAATKRAARGDEQPVSIFAAPFVKEATIWATIDAKLVMLRQLHLPPSEDLSALSSSVASEVRRTTFALSEQLRVHEGASVWIAGKKPDKVSELTDLLREKLEAMEVQPMDFAADSALLSTRIDSEDAASVALPLAGLALDESAGNKPLIDLLHPRKKPAPRTGQRTYVLAAAAAAALVFYACWHGYKQLHTPVAMADEVRAKLQVLEKSAEKLSAEEEFAETIQAWSENSVNMLTELRQLSEKIRPVPLDAEDFPVDDDVMLKQLNIAGLVMNFDAAVREYSAVAPLENRLRDGGVRVQRATAEPNEEPENYKWLIKPSIDFSEDAATLEEQPTS